MIEVNLHNKNVKVTVITVCFNAVNVIENTIKSVLNQTYENIEYVVVDGGSSDGTLRIIRENMNGISKMLSEHDEGIFDAMNKGISLASGDWIIFMNAGDVFTNEHVIEDLSDVLADKDADVIYGPYFLKYKNKKRLISPIPFFEQVGRYKTMGFSHQSCLVRSSLARENSFDIKYGLSADYRMIWDLYHRIGARFVKTSIPICIMDEEVGATTRNYKKHLLEECEICGYPSDFRRDAFVELQFFSYRIKRIIKSIFFS